MLKSTLIYLEKAGKYLMLHRVRKKNDVNHDKWIGVGGRFEPGETAEVCARREVTEETGYVMGCINYRGIVTFISDTAPHEEMHLFTCDDFQGEMHDCDEGVLEWVPQSDVASLPTWEGDRIFLRLLAEGRPFFHLELRYHGDAPVGASLEGEALEIGR